MTVKELKSALQNLQRGSDAYDSAYHAAMDRIFAQGKGSREKAQKILAWILCAYRPLSTYELLHALAVEPGDTEFDEDNMMETEQVLAICAGLVTIDEQSDNVRFIHYTTQDYLQRNQQVWLPKANVEIARTCIAYLSIDDFAVGPCSSREDYDRRQKEFTLLNYATTYWGPHTNSLMGQGCIPGASEALTEAQALLLDTKCLSSASQALFMLNMWSYWGTDVIELGKGFSGCHWLGRFGLLLLLEEWVSRQYDLDQYDFSGRTPLSWAAENGHEAVVKLLIGCDKVDVDSKDKSGRTPLSWAAENGEEVVVKLLVETGKVDVDSKDNFGQTPLARAAAKGQEAVVTLMVKTGKVDIDSKDEHGRTPLARAAENGQEAVVTLMVKTGKVDVDSKDEHGRTPLARAAENGQEAVTKLLIGCDKVDVDSKDKSGRTPLSWAAENGEEVVAKLLVETGKVDVDSKDNFGQTPLARAAAKGQEAVVTLMVKTGKVDIDSKDEHGRTPLARAAENGQEAVVKLLIGSDKVDVDSKNSYGQTPLSRAAWKGHEAIVKLLVSTGKVDVDPKEGNGRTPLSLAAWNGRDAVVKLLIRCDKVDVDSQDEQGRTPLSWAAVNGREAIVKSLIETGKVDVDFKDKSGRTPLSWAAWNGYEAVVELLIGTGKVNLDSKDDCGRTPLSRAAVNGHELMVKLLLKELAKSHPQDVRCGSSFGTVKCDQDIHISNLNIAQSRGVDIPDTFGRTPLMWAAMGGHISLIRSLWPSALEPESSAITLKDILGCSLIHLFAIGDCSEGICLLLDTGFDINTTDFQGWTPLYWAAHYNRERLVSLLLERQAYRGLRNSRVWTVHGITLSIGADNFLEVRKPSLTDENDQTSRTAQKFDAYCDNCQQVSLFFTLKQYFEVPWSAN
jgi:ankyrin repeat protein